MENTQNQNTFTKTIISIIVFLGVAVGAIALALNGKKDEAPAVTRDETTEATTTTLVATTTVATTTETVQPSSKQYKDGTYSATGSYNSPGGLDKVGVSITLKDDIVTAAVFTPMPGDPRSADFQSKFAGGYKASVVGKNINDIKVGKVSGSSLTSIGFNAALEEIKVQASQS